MFTKASLVMIVALLVAILVNQRSQGVQAQAVQAQAQIEYKVVDTGYYVTPDGKQANPGERGAKLLTTKDALDEYGKAGWQLVTQSYILGNTGFEHLIFMRK
jgi:hypothetical protein